MTGGARGHWGDPGRRSAPDDPESEDLLALAAAAVGSIANPAYGFQGRKGLVQSSRIRGDLCPGVLRPWPADDGFLVRLRLVGGHLSGRQMDGLLCLAERLGDGAVHLTSRANLQIRGIASVSEEAVTAFEAIGLLPSRKHELARNIMVSPQSGFSGGRADLRSVARELDRLLVADPLLAGLPGRFLFVLDDGRGDLLDRPCDLGLVALDGTRAQLRIGDRWGVVVPLEQAARELIALARVFRALRGDGPAAAWHVRELAEPLAPEVVPDADMSSPMAALPYGPAAGGTHHEVSEGRLTRASALVLLDEPVLVVTPWRGIFIPDPTEQQ